MNKLSKAQIKEKIYISFLHTVRDVFYIDLIAFNNCIESRRVSDFEFLSCLNFLNTYYKPKKRGVVMRVIIEPCDDIFTRLTGKTYDQFLTTISIKYSIPKHISYKGNDTGIFLENKYICNNCNCSSTYEQVIKRSNSSFGFAGETLYCPKCNSDKLKFIYAEGKFFNLKHFNNLKIMN